MYLRIVSIFNKSKDAQGNIKSDHKIICFISLIPHISFICSITLGLIFIHLYLKVTETPSWLSRCSKKYPDVLVALKTDTQKNLMEQVINRELDGAFINVQCLHHNISSVFTKLPQSFSQFCVVK
jgi:hypothetical protein